MRTVASYRFASIKGWRTRRLMEKARVAKAEEELIKAGVITRSVGNVIHGSDDGDDYDESD
jgi:hypothetical protein